MSSSSRYFCSLPREWEGFLCALHPPCFFSLRRFLAFIHRKISCITHIFPSSWSFPSLPALVEGLAASFSRAAIVGALLWPGLGQQKCRRVFQETCSIAVSRPSSVSLPVSQFLPPDSQPSLQSLSHPLISGR